MEELLRQKRVTPEARPRFFFDLADDSSALTGTGVDAEAAASFTPDARRLVTLTSAGAAVDARFFPFSILPCASVLSLTPSSEVCAALAEERVGREPLDVAGVDVAGMTDQVLRTSATSLDSVHALRICYDDEL